MLIFKHAKFFLEQSGVCARKLVSELTASRPLCAQVLLSSHYLMTIENLLGKDPVHTVGEQLNSLSRARALSSPDLSLSFSKECLARQIPISSMALMILIVSIITY